MRNKGKNKYMKYVCILQILRKENKRLMELYPLLNKASNFEVI